MPQERLLEAQEAQRSETAKVDEMMHEINRLEQVISGLTTDIEQRDKELSDAKETIAQMTPMGDFINLKATLREQTAKTAMCEAEINMLQEELNHLRRELTRQRTAFQHASESAPEHDVGLSAESNKALREKDVALAIAIAEKEEALDKLSKATNDYVALKEEMCAVRNNICQTAGNSCYN